MNKFALTITMIASFSSVSHGFCLKQYSRQMNRFVAMTATESQKTNFAAKVAKATPAQVEGQAVRRQK